MKLLITGSNGFLGYRLLRFFAKEYEVYAMNHYDLDVTDLNQVYSVLQRVKPDIVVHCAAVSDIAACETEVDFAYKVNVTGTVNMAKGCKELKAKLIFCSSDQIYGTGAAVGGHSETEDLKPVKMYARLKQEAEKAALSVYGDTVCLRLTAMYDNDYDTGREHYNLLSYIIRDLKGKNYMYYSENEYRGFTDVKDVMRNLPKAFGLPGGVYNFGCENNLNTFQLMSDLMTALYQDASLIQKKEQGFINLCMDTAKIKKYGIKFPSTYDGLINALKDC